MRFLVFQHIAIEHPGVLREFMAADGIAWDVVELDEGAAIPSLDGYDGLIVMGGPMDVWQEDEYPWLVDEKAAIHEAVAVRGVPCLGICLGHQLLADAMGGTVGPMAEPEVGVLDVTLLPAGARDPFLEGIPPHFRCLQWHSAEVKALPRTGTALAFSPVSAVQAMRVGPRAFGIQYHVEITRETVPQWSQVPAYREALEATLGPGALAGLGAAVAENLDAFSRDARRLYDNFLAVFETV